MMNSSRMHNRSGRLSHEARLGVMLISVLVFTFGFMVYRKVDLHHNSLQSAAIASTASPSDGTEDTHEAEDPLQTLTDEIVFSEPTVATSQQESWTEEQTADSTTAVVSFSQFPDEPEGAFGQQQQGAVAVDAGTLPATTHTSEIDNSASVTFDFAFAEHSPGAQPGEPQTVVGGPSSTAATVSGFTQLEQQPSDFDAEPEIQIPEFDLGGTATTLLQTPSTETRETQLAPASLAQADPQERLELPAETAFLTPAEFDAPGGNGAAQEAAESTVERFPAIDNPAGSGNPAEDVYVAAADELNTFPEILPEDPPAAIRSAPTTGFPAATFENPSGPFGQSPPSFRESRTPARTASGAGQDGRFSVAAWNYQNSTDVPVPDPDRTYRTVKVENGDNYYTISRRVYGSTRYFSALALFNQHRIPDPRRMRPGMIVLIPEAKELEQKFPEFFAERNRQAQPKGFFLLEDGSPAYRTGERETLSEISQRFLGRASRWIEIYELNRSVIRSPDNLRAGTVLGLPGDAVEVQIIP